MDQLMELEHTFVEKTFQRFRKCGGCKRRSLWSRISKCNDCRLFCHNKCMTPALTGNWPTEDATTTASSNLEEAVDVDTSPVEIASQASGGAEDEGLVNDGEQRTGEDAADDEVSGERRDKPVPFLRRVVIAFKKKLMSIKKRRTMRSHGPKTTVHDSRRDEESSPADEMQDKMAGPSRFNPGIDTESLDVKTSLTNIESTVAEVQMFFGKDAVEFPHVISMTRVYGSKNRVQEKTSNHDTLEASSAAVEDIPAAVEENKTEHSDEYVEPKREMSSE